MGLNARQKEAMSESALSEIEVDEVAEMLAAAEAKAAEKVEVKLDDSPPPLSQEEQLKNQLLASLRSLPGAPNEAAIETLRATYGKDGLYVLAISGTEAYIFTYLRRARWMGINEAVQKAVETGIQKDGNMFIKTQVIKSCLLWPKVGDNTTFWQGSRAGLIDTLFDVIMAHSAFLQLSQAMMLTTQL